MTIIATRLSAKVEVGFSAVVAFSTRVVELKTGYERRNANWLNPKRRFTARTAGWNAEMRAELLNLAHAARGSLYSWLFKDWNDYSVTAQSLGVAPSGTTAVQLVKTYTYGSETYTRTITKPVASTVTVYQNGVAKAGSLDEATGLFIPTTAWTTGQPLTWTGEFLVPVRFASDDIEFVLPHRDIAEVVCELVEVFGE
jgi:uncharacterized protein (TIGR02217 family)